MKTDYCRCIPLTQGELWNEGIEGEETKQSEITGTAFIGKYVGNKWGGKYLRAPDIFFTILEKGKGKLVRLGDIAEVRRGFTTGANEFFYVKIIGTGREDGLVKVKNNAGWDGELEEEFLVPIIKSPREVKSISANPDDLKWRAMMCHKSKNELKGSHVPRLYLMGRVTKLS